MESGTIFGRQGSQSGWRGVVDLITESDQIGHVQKPEISQFLFAGDAQRKGAGQVDTRSGVESLGVGNFQIGPTQNLFPEFLQVKRAGIDQRTGFGKCHPHAGQDRLLGMGLEWWLCLPY